MVSIIDMSGMLFFYFLFFIFIFIFVIIGKIVESQVPDLRNLCHTK